MRESPHCVGQPPQALQQSPPDIRSAVARPCCVWSLSRSLFLMEETEA